MNWFPFSDVFVISGLQCIHIYRATTWRLSIALRCLSILAQSASLAISSKRLKITPNTISPRGKRQNHAHLWFTLAVSCRSCAQLPVMENLATFIFRQARSLWRIYVLHMWASAAYGTLKSGGTQWAMARKTGAPYRNGDRWYWGRRGEAWSWLYSYIKVNKVK